MSGRIILTGAIALVILGSQAAMAQSGAANPRAGAQSLAPAGQGPGAQSSLFDSGKDTKSRTDVTSQVRSAERARSLAPAGESPLPQGQAIQGNPDEAKRSISEESRAQVKADTRAASLHGHLRPAGEAARPLDAPEKQ